MEALVGVKSPTKVNIIVTQPRRFVAVGVAERISDERNIRIAGVVGYQIRLENKISSSTRLIFCTTGILFRRLHSDPLLVTVTHLIIMGENDDILLIFFNFFFFRWIGDGRRTSDDGKQQKSTKQDLGVVGGDSSGKVRPGIVEFFSEM